MKTRLISIIFLSPFVQADQSRQFYCEYYAKDAVEQHAANLKYSCGFTGPRWNDDEKGQYEWCLTVNENITNAENNAREDALNACFQQKSDPANTENQPAIPATCKEASNTYAPVKNIYHDYRYEKGLKQPVHNGLIAHDFNHDKKPDFLFLERTEERARIAACFSGKNAYKRQLTDVDFYVQGYGLEGEQYDLSQKGDELVLDTQFFGHNMGSCYRTTHYHYQAEKQRFVIVDDQGDCSPVTTVDGSPYPISPPITRTLMPLQ
jgi:hypothetical protein